jgi:putative transposase
MNKENNLKPITNFRISRRNLSHWEYPGSTYFVTYKTAPGFLLNNTQKDIVYRSIIYFEEKKYLLHAFVVMSTHVHMIISPQKISENNYYSLAQIMHSIKSFSANRIRKDLNIINKVWLDEKYERIVRNDDELVEEMSYIVNNPVKDGIVAKPEEYEWLYFRPSG